MPSTPARMPSAPAAHLLGLDALDDDPAAIGNPGVIERLVDRLVGIAVFHVLPDHGDPHFVDGILDSVDQLAPIADVELAGFQAEPFHQHLVETVVHEAQRHFVDAILLVAAPR